MAHVMSFILFYHTVEEKGPNGHSRTEKYLKLRIYWMKLMIDQIWFGELKDKSIEIIQTEALLDEINTDLE